MKTSQPVKVGLDSMLTPDNCVLMLIDHQPFQVSGVKNIDAALMINNVVALAKAAKAFGVPTLLTTVVKDKGGRLIILEHGGATATNLAWELQLLEGRRPGAGV
jgi:nicotinamidase-related amidase